MHFCSGGVYSEDSERAETFISHSCEYLVDPRIMFSQIFSKYQNVIGMSYTAFVALWHLCYPVSSAVGAQKQFDHYVNVLYSGLVSKLQFFFKVTSHI